MRTIFTAVAACCFASASFAQEVPQEVIDQCQSSVGAHELPGCLSSGAIGHILLGRVVQPEYFGAPVERVVAICLEQNDMFSGAWSCFERAAERAVETANLIGRDAIADECVRAMADAELLERLDQEERSLRSALMPQGAGYGGGVFYPFRGCQD